MENDYRKLIKFGNSSHILSLPKGWLKKNKLKKGDLVYFSENGNNELVLSPQLKEEDHEDEITIVDNNDIKELYRKLIANYIAGYDLINIRFNTPERLEIIKTYLASLTGFEIIEQNSDHIKVKDLLDIKEVYMEKVIRRMDALIRSVMEDTKLSHKKNNYESIYKRDFEINKLTFLSYRLIKKCTHYPKLAQLIGIKYDRLIDEWMLVFYLEKLGDEVKRISRYLTRLKARSEKIKDVIALYSEACNDYNRCMNAYYKHDINVAYNVAKEKELIVKKADLLIEKNNNQYVFNIIDRIKALGSHIRDISRSIYQDKR
jgi:phosphate uptake regulator